MKEVLTRVYPELDSAVAEFRYFVPWYKRKSFDRAWKTYRFSDGIDRGDPSYYHYMGYDSYPDPKGTFHKNISLLLSFAKVK